MPPIATGAKNGHTADTAFRGLTVHAVMHAPSAALHANAAAGAAGNATIVPATNPAWE
jgi:hypothetical protein